MTQLHQRARLHALIARHIDESDDPLPVVDDLLAEAIAVNAVVGSKTTTAALLRKFADALDGSGGADARE